MVKRGDKEKRAASAASVAGRKPEEAAVSPPLKARKFEKYIDEVPKGADGKEHLLRISEGVVREVLSENYRGYELQDGVPKELEMMIGWAKSNDKTELEEEVLNEQFLGPYNYVKAGEVVVRPHLRKELLETTEVVGFGYESDGRDSEANDFGFKSEAGTVAEPENEGYRTARTRWKEVQAKFEKRVLSDFRYQMQTGN